MQPSHHGRPDSENSGLLYRLLNSDSDSEEQANAPEPQSICYSFFINHWDKLFFAIQSITTVAQSIWTGRKIYGEDDTVLLGITAYNYIYFATACYSLTYIIGRGGRFFKETEKKNPEKINASKTTIYLVTTICLLNATIKSFSIIASCLDSEDSIFSTISDGHIAAKIVGGAIGAVSAIGSFRAARNYYVSDAIRNTKIIVDTFKTMPQKDYWTIFKDITAMLITLFSSIAYAMFYYLYMTSIITMTANDLNLPEPSSNMPMCSKNNIKMYCGIAALLISTLNNFLSTYQQIREIIDKPHLFFLITQKNKQGKKTPLRCTHSPEQDDDDKKQKLTLNLFGLLIQIVGFLDTACGVYSGLALTNLDYCSPLLSNATKICMASYPIAYVGYYVNQGAAYEATRLSQRIGITCFGHRSQRGRSQSEDREDSQLDILSHTPQASLMQ